MTGMSALRSAWCSVTRRSGSPFARAVRTYSRPSTSSIDERDIRVTMAAVAVPSVRAGSAIIVRLATGDCNSGTHTSDGIQPRYTEKSRMSTVPCQKAGSDRPRVAPTRITESRVPPRHTAAPAPSGTPITSDHATASTASSADTGSRSRKSASTGRPESHDTPRSPRTTPASQCAYCTGTGRSSPKYARKDATTSGDAMAACPSSCSTTVPGTIRTIRNTTTLTPSSVSAVASSRRARYAANETLAVHRREPQPVEEAGGMRLESLHRLLHRVQQIRRIQGDRDGILRHQPLHAVVDLLAAGAVQRRAAAVEQLVRLRVLPAAKVLAARRRMEVPVEGLVGIHEPAPLVHRRRRLRHDPVLDPHAAVHGLHIDVDAGVLEVVHDDRQRRRQRRKADDVANGHRHAPRVARPLQQRLCLRHVALLVGHVGGAERPELQP